MIEQNRVTNDYNDFQKFDPDNQQFFTAGELIDFLSRFPKDAPVETCRYFGEYIYKRKYVTAAYAINKEDGLEGRHVLLRLE